MGIESWFLRMAEFGRPDGAKRLGDALVKPGDIYTWRWHGWPDEVEELGRIIDCNGIDYFKFSFGDAGNCVVTIKEESQGYPLLSCSIRHSNDERRTIGI
ncbi:MAG: hypothetical protein IPP25_18475 [Saprospiraceae bacterium]|nr:hypothetical protein [Candidatus Opimibacter skivensis]